ncbi:MAG: NADH-quinone oxidoreductase subunit I [Candidatus Zixiibacteriota bacterium]|nr:MAG: NADH-quinone oxidoreductase subunit I [candidate division Zixibacteria bacterium]
MRKLIDAIKNLVIGLFTTGKHLGRHAVTLQYPTQRWEMPGRSRGIVVLLSDKETGELNCTVCMLCMRACPSAAINIEFEKNEKGKRILKDFTVDNTICCFCGLCQESFNFAAIKMAPKYEFSTLDKEGLIWHRDKLQEMGRDVPYEKPVRKKPAAKPGAKPSPKPAAAPAANNDEKPQPAKAEVNPKEAEQPKPKDEADAPSGAEKKAEERPEDKSGEDDK